MILFTPDGFISAFNCIQMIYVSRYFVSVFVFAGDPSVKKSARPEWLSKYNYLFLLIGVLFGSGGHGEQF